MEEEYAWSFEVGEGIGSPEGGSGLAPAAGGGAIEGGTPGVLHVRRTSYYHFGGKRVAMRQVDSWGGDVLYYLAGDHVRSLNA
jgi:hypothetical protein